MDLGPEELVGRDGPFSLGVRIVALPLFLEMNGPIG